VRRVLTIEHCIRHLTVRRPKSEAIGTQVKAGVVNMGGALGRTTGITGRSWACACVAVPPSPGWARRVESIQFPRGGAGGPTLGR